jgi:hypothetical protein
VAEQVRQQIVRVARPQVAKEMQVAQVQIWREMHRTPTQAVEAARRRWALVALAELLALAVMVPRFLVPLILAAAEEDATRRGLLAEVAAVVVQEARAPFRLSREQKTRAAAAAVAAAVMVATARLAAKESSLFVTQSREMLWLTLLNWMTSAP